MERDFNYLYFLSTLHHFCEVPVPQFYQNEEEHRTRVLGSWMF
jgi:hypothetical protein